MAGNQNHLLTGLLNPSNASSSTISTRSTLSHASNQSNTPNNTNHVNTASMLGQQGSNQNGHGGLAGSSSSQGIGGNMSQLLASHNLLQSPFGQQLNNGQSNTSSLGATAAAVAGIGAGFSNNTNNSSLLNGSAPGVGVPGNAPSFGGLNHVSNAPNGLFGAAQVSDINMANQTGMEAGTSEIQKFAEQSRNHGKMIEFFIEHHLPPLMKTDKLIKELGKMDFDTFQNNYSNNANLIQHNYGFEFDHLNNSNNNNNGNSLPTLEKDQSQQLEQARQRIKQLQDELNKTSNTMNAMRQQIVDFQNKEGKYKQQITELQNQLRMFQQQQHQQQQQQLQQQAQQQQQQQQRQIQRNDISMATNGNNNNHNNNSNNVANHSNSPHLAVKYVRSQDPADDSGKEMVKCTESVDELRKEIQRRKKIDESNWNIEADKEFNPYLDPILNYLMHNEENKLHPDLTYGGGRKEQGDNEEEEPTTPQRDMIETFAIPNGHRSQKLIGQSGLRAKTRLPSNTVLGQYCGVEYLLNEYQRTFNHHPDWKTKLTYAYNLEITMPKNENEQAHGQGEQWPGGSKCSVIIDALFKPDIDNNNNNNNGQYERSLLTYINDCRTDINSPMLTEEDKRLENVKFVKVYVNGWPMIFVVACADIEQGSELRAFYGPDYDISPNNGSRIQVQQMGQMGQMGQMQQMPQMGNNQNVVSAVRTQQQQQQQQQAQQQQQQMDTTMG